MFRLDQEVTRNDRLERQLDALEAGSTNNTTAPSLAAPGNALEAHGDVENGKMAQHRINPSSEPRQIIKADYFQPRCMNLHERVLPDLSTETSAHQVPEQDSHSEMCAAKDVIDRLQQLEKFKAETITAMEKANGLIQETRRDLRNPIELPTDSLPDESWSISPGKVGTDGLQELLCMMQSNLRLMQKCIEASE